MHTSSPSGHAVPLDSYAILPREVRQRTHMSLPLVLWGGGSVCIGVGWRAAATPNIFFTNRIQRALLLVLLFAGTKRQSSRIFVDKLAPCSDRPRLKSPARRHPAHCTQASRRPRFPPPPSLMPAAAPPHDVCRAAAASASHEAKMPCGPSCSSPPPSPSPPRGGASSRLGLGGV